MAIFTALLGMEKSYGLITCDNPTFMNEKTFNYHCLNGRIFNESREDNYNSNNHKGKSPDFR